MKLKMLAELKASNLGALRGVAASSERPNGVLREYEVSLSRARLGPIRVALDRAVTSQGTANWRSERRSTVRRHSVHDNYYFRWLFYDLARHSGSVVRKGQVHGTGIGLVSTDLIIHRHSFAPLNRWIFGVEWRCLEPSMSRRSQL